MMGRPDFKAAYSSAMQLGVTSRSFESTSTTALESNTASSASLSPPKRTVRSRRREISAPRTLASAECTCDDTWQHVEWHQQHATAREGTSTGCAGIREYGCAHCTRWSQHDLPSSSQGPTRMTDKRAPFNVARAAATEALAPRGWGWVYEGGWRLARAAAKPAAGLALSLLLYLPRERPAVLCRAPLDLSRGEDRLVASARVPAQHGAAAATLLRGRELVEHVHHALLQLAERDIVELLLDQIEPCGVLL
eukprot:5290026-Prymnesium_polylepis.1